MCSCEWPGRLKCLATGLDRSDPLFLTSSKELMNGHVLQTSREQLKVTGSRLEGSELLTSEFPRF